MKLTQLEKAKKLHDRLTELAGEIEQLQKTAVLIANKKSEIKFSLKVTDKEKVSDKNKVTIDADGFMKRGGCSDHSTFSGLWGFIDPTRKASSQKKVYDAEVKEIIPDNVALQVLGVILAGKIEAKELAEKALKKLGVSL